MTAPLVRAMRLSFTWVESNPVLLEDPAPPAPFAFLGRDYTYEARFDEVRGRGKSAEGLMLPWPRPEGQHFWTFYLEGATPGSVKAGDAWHALVPFRVSPPLRARADWFPGSATVEGFFHPHAIVAMLTFTVTAPQGAPLTLERSVELAHQLRGNGKLTLAGPAGAAGELVLDALKDRVRAHLRELCLGPGAAEGRIPTKPFSVVTFLALENASPTVPPAQDDEVHRALQALAEWSPTWRDDELQPIAEHVLPRRKASPKGDVVFAGPRGRVVWLPKFAGDPPPARPKLSCYHRNQVFAAMQVDALGALVSAADERLGRWDGVPAPFRECARNAAGALTRLYLGKPSVYQSASCRRQVEDAHLVDALKRVRERNRMQELALV